MIEKTPSSSRHPDYLLDIRKIFLAALVFGVVGIVLPQAFGYNKLSVVLPLALMLAYAVIGYRRSQDSPFLEQFADSVYYLGFLFTLIALVVSLYYYRSDSIEVESIIANFSLALTTTIFGLAVRIYINNFQVDLRSAERQMLDGVEYAAADFVRKAKTLSMQLELSHDETQNAIRQSIDDAAAGIATATGMIEKQAAMSSKALAEHVQTVNRSVVVTVRELERKISATELPEDVFARRLEAPIGALIRRLEQTRKVVDELTREQTVIKTGYHDMTRELDHMNAALTASGRSLTAFSENIAAQNLAGEDFVNQVDHIGRLIQAADHIAQSIGEQSDRSSAAVDRFTKLLDSIERLPNETERIVDSLRQASDKMVDVFTRIGDHSRHGKQIGDDLENIAEALSKTHVTVKQISDFGLHVTSAFKRLESFNQAIELHTQNLAAMGDLANTDIELVKKHQQDMAAILEHSRTAMALLSRHFVDSIDYLSKRLQD